AVCAARHRRSPDDDYREHDRRANQQRFLLHSPLVSIVMCTKPLSSSSSPPASTFHWWRRLPRWSARLPPSSLAAGRPAHPRAQPEGHRGPFPRGGAPTVGTPCICEPGELFHVRDDAVSELAALDLGGPVHEPREIVGH